MPTIHSFKPRHCALCSRRVRTTKLLALYVVGSRAAIQYTLCADCGQQAREGLPPDQLRVLDKTMEAEAKRLGLTTSH